MLFVLLRIGLFLVLVYWLYRALKGKKGISAQKKSETISVKQIPSSLSQQSVKHAFTTLELPDSATSDEIDTQYEKLQAQYESTASSDLPTDLRRYAEKRRDEVKAAYETIKAFKNGLH